MTITELKNLSKEELLEHISDLNNSIDTIKNNFLEALETKNETIKCLIDNANLVSLHEQNDLYLWNSEEENNINTLCEETGVLIYAKDLRKLLNS